MNKLLNIFARQHDKIHSEKSLAEALKKKEEEKQRKEVKRKPAIKIKPKDDASGKKKKNDDYSEFVE